MYLGLILVPWIVLYGVTALLFNHADWLSLRQTSSLHNTDLSGFPEAEQIARQAIQSLGDDAITLVPNSSSWLGHISFQGANDSHKIRTYIHPGGKGGYVRLDPKEIEPPAWSEELKNWTPISEEQKDNFEQHALRLVKNERVDISSLSLRRYPSVRFQVLHNGDLHTIKLRLHGSVNVEKGSGSASIRSKLLRLHVMHGSPGYIGVRWIWARIVDLMGIAMITWGITGILMWWLMRSTRVQGFIALSVGCTVIVTLAIGIWINFGMF